MLRGSRVTLDELIDHHLADDLDGLCQAHPRVSDYHVEQVAEIVADVLQDVPDERRARRQLKRQAHWALVSERASIFIEQETDGLSNPPQREELLTLARRALEHLEPDTAAVAPGGSQQEAGAGEQSAGRAHPGSALSGSRNSLQKLTAELTDCASRIRNAADQLQVDHPVHAAYVRELVTRLDELLVDLLPPQHEG